MSDKPTFTVTLMIDTPKGVLMCSGHGETWTALMDGLRETVHQISSRPLETFKTPMMVRVDDATGPEVDPPVTPRITH